MGEATRVAEKLQTYRADILRLAAQHGTGNVRVFGSVARGDATPDSDLDLLVEMESGRTLLDLSRLLLDLQELLDCKVDVVTERALHSYIRDKVLQEAKPL